MEALLLLALAVLAAAVVGLYLLGIPKNTIGPGINNTANNVKDALNNL